MQRVILVLGGGGVKGMAHIGAWKAMEEAGLEVAEIVGTSIGALVGACIAGGMGWRELAPLAVALRKRDIVSLNGRAVLVNGIRQRSVFHGDRLAEYIRSVLPVERFEELRRPLSVNAVDLETGRTEWFGAGGRMDVGLAEAVYASCALPLFYPPAEIGGRHYVDGGVGAALAVERARERGAELVVAVDVSAGPVKDALDTISKGMVAIHHRVFDIMSHAQREAQLSTWSGPPLIYVRPRLDGISTFDFGRTDFFLEEGYRAARAAIGEWKRAVVPAD
ncbi:MAG TPA: patatin-like phospholipase family protein [Longimicrobiales bacterium]